MLKNRRLLGTAGVPIDGKRLEFAPMVQVRTAVTLVTTLEEQNRTGGSRWGPSESFQIRLIRTFRRNCSDFRLIWRANQLHDVLISVNRTLWCPIYL